MNDLVEALTSVKRICERDPRDWSANRHDAFLYGVFVGWQQCVEAHEHDEWCRLRESDVAHTHNWDGEFVARLDRLHAAVEAVLAAGAST